MNHLITHKHRESSYLRAYKAHLHLSRTLYKSTLFMQNKPNLLDAQMNVNTVITMNYEQITMNNANKNKPNSNPNKPNFKRGTYTVLRSVAQEAADTIIFNLFLLTPVNSIVILVFLLY